MMTKLEDNDYEDLVITLARAYVESNLTWMQFQQLARQVAQPGDEDASSLNGVIAHTFNLDTQLAINLRAMMNPTLGCDQLECISPSDQ